VGEKASVTLLFVTLGLLEPISAASAKKDKVEVTLTAPVSGALYQAPAAIVLSAIARAKQKNHPIAKVEFFQGTNLIGAVAGPRGDDQYTLNWTGVAAGNYAVTARATNDKGDTDLSDPVSITVNALPSVSLTSPGSNTAFKAPASIPLAVQVADTDGSIANVEYFYGTTSITSLSAPPYSFVWTEVPQGTYALTARVTDNLGGVMTSVAVNVTVNAAEAKLYYIHVDHLNTPRLVADSTGTTVWRWDQQEPFGVNVPDENPSGLETFDLPLRLPGQYFDKETNLHYNYFRDYDPGLGRFPQFDPIGLHGGINGYAYVGGNPISVRDPLGLDNPGMGPYGPSRSSPQGVSICSKIWHPHTFMCAGDNCSGKYPSGNPFYSPGEIRDDSPNKSSASCSVVPPGACDQDVFAKCVADRIGSRGPSGEYYNYMVGNCGDWSEDVITQCRRQCTAK